MSTPTLNRTECNVLRGLAIIGIFLHNYCHWLGPIVKVRNEYQYIQRNVDWLHPGNGVARRLAAHASAVILRTLWSGPYFSPAPTDWC